MRTILPQTGCDFPAQVDAALAAAFLDRACPAWEADQEAPKEAYIAALQAQLSVEGLGMGSLAATQSAPWWNSCTVARTGGSSKAET